MEGIARLKYLLIVGLFVNIVGNKNWGFIIEGVDGAGECGTLNPEVLAYKLAPCAAAAQDKNVAVAPKCCALMKKVRTSCLCAIILSKESKSLGVKVDVAATIPKRCNVSGRTNAYKCGAYTVPA